MKSRSDRRSVHDVSLPLGSDPHPQVVLTWVKENMETFGRVPSGTHEPFGQPGYTVSEIIRALEQVTEGVPVWRRHFERPRGYPLIASLYPRLMWSWDLTALGASGRSFALGIPVDFAEEAYADMRKVLVDEGCAKIIDQPTAGGRPLVEVLNQEESDD